MMHNLDPRAGRLIIQLNEASLVNGKRKYIKTDLEVEDCDD